MLNGLIESAPCDHYPHIFDRVIENDRELDALLAELHLVLGDSPQVQQVIDQPLKVFDLPNDSLQGALVVLR